MACCPPPPHEAGFATPGAMLIGAAIALVAVWSVVRGDALLRRARADHDRAAYEYVLEGAQLTAAAEVVRTEPGGAYAWILRSDLGPLEVVAQPERDKLSLAAAARLDPAQLARFQVADPARLLERLATAAADPAQVEVGGLDPSPLWRECGPAMVSPFGQAQHPTFQTPREPVAGPEPSYWRIGEAWRVRLATSAGWRDDRLVRFTGDPGHPTATIVRRFWRGSVSRGTCDAILQALAAS